MASGTVGALALRESGARAARGLEAYRANAESIAERALAAAFATVQAMLGAEDFARLAREFWLAHPPEHGDLGEWGEALPSWIEAHTGLADWPWLADTARLDFALHRNERAADAAPDLASLNRLESTDPADLRIELMPGTALIESRWPLVRIHRAHQLEGDAAMAAFAEVREAIAASRGEAAFVVRQGWRGVVHSLDAPTARWTCELLAGADLSSALQRAGEGFDFAAWLGTSVREIWLKGVVAARD
jgi:Putative DNA-binding domain